MRGNRWMRGEVLFGLGEVKVPKKIVSKTVCNYFSATN
jgi:hypothetical protein